jgi:capsular exopolysaccharide synthesis family protein
MLATHVANTLVHQYIDEQVATKRASLERAHRLVTGRLAEAGRNLRIAELAASDYMLANELPRVGSGSAPDAQQPASLRRELAAVRADRAAKEGRLVQLREILERRGSYESLPEVAGSVTIQNLQQQAATLRAQEAQAATVYGSSHPQRQQVSAQRESIARRITEEIQAIVRGISEEASRARVRESQLEQALRGSVKEYVASESASIRLNELTRVVDTRSAAYSALLARLGSLEEQRDAVQPQAEVVAAAAIPQSRDFPRLRTMLVIGLVSSIILALGFTAVAEHLDQGLHAASDVERALGLPNLAIVPRVKRGWGRGEPYEHVLHSPQSPYAEAIRGLSLGIRLAAGGRTAKVLLVTSSQQGEGKTTLAISLAALTARAGRRALVVDLDLRHPRVGQQLRLRKQPGLVEYVQGEASLDEIIQPVSVQEGLYAIPVCGPVPDPAAILASPRLGELIALLRLRYDAVVLDVPPSLGITDAQIVGQLADAALYVVRWGSTTEAAAANGLAALDKAGIGVVGCALTQVDRQQHALYGDYDVGLLGRSHAGNFR